MGKSRVAPLKPVTIPRLELTAAVVASKIGCVLRKELECKGVKETYWTDSKTVLGYINNDARRFHVFVGNRVNSRQDIAGTVALHRNETKPRRYRLSWFWCGRIDRQSFVAERPTTSLEARQRLDSHRCYSQDLLR